MNYDRLEVEFHEISLSWFFKKKKKLVIFIS